MSEHLKSPASTSESEQTKQQAKMNAIRSSLQKLEEEEEEEMLQQRIAANIQKKRFRNGLFQNHRHPSNILSGNEKNVPNGKSCGISFQSGEMGSVKQ